MKDPAPAPAAGSDKPVKPILRGSAAVEFDSDDDLLAPPSMSECVFRVFHSDKNAHSEPPSEFREREAYKILEAEGLTDTPPSAGCGLFYHKSTQQWHARFGLHGEINCAPSWNATLRSERKAVLLALHAMWKWWSALSKNKPDGKYVAVLEKALRDTAF